MNCTHGVLGGLRRRGEEDELVVDVGEDRIIQSIPDSEGVVAPTRAWREYHHVATYRVKADPRRRPDRQTLLLCDRSLSFSQSLA